MNTSKKEDVTLESVVITLVNTMPPLFDENSEYLFWGTLISSLGDKGVELVHEVSGISTGKLQEEYKRFKASCNTQS